MSREFYFDKFEERRPYPSVSANPYRTALFQFFGILTIATGISYLHWRWCYSLNPDALWFAIPLVVAETLSFISTTLMIITFWSFKDAQKNPPVHMLSEIEDVPSWHDRPVHIDVFIATYNEDVELVRLSIIDAKKLRYPHPDVRIEIYVLDDGRRDGRNPNLQNMKEVALQEGVGYLHREHNEGYKAGNLKNGLEHTKGDIFAILDADTRVFPDFLCNTTGYFRKKTVAWVQTPQWFYDTSEPEKLSDVIHAKIKTKNKYAKLFINRVFGSFHINEDIFGNDPRLFYDVILRKRNYFNAAFCCGAGSIHRREAIMGLAVKDFAAAINKFEKELEHNHEPNREVHEKANAMIVSQEMIPFKFHASEDIYTSIMLHSDKQSKWESIQHPDVECRMLSTQDLDSWIKQHQRYAAGTLDIAFNDNPIFKKGLTVGQKLCYFTTIWSYFAPVWIIIFLLSPIAFFFSMSLPVVAYSFDFFKYFLPFQILNTITVTLGCWGISTNRGDQYYIAGFWYMLLAIVEIIRGKKVKFNVTPKDKAFGKNTKHILPHVILIMLNITGIIYNIIMLVLHKHPTPSGFAANTFWCTFNIISLSVIIRAAYWTPLEQKYETV